MLACVPDSAIVAYEGQFRWKQPDPSQPEFMELVWDIVENGQLVPVIVRHDEKGRLVLVDGQRRLQAIRYINARGLYRSATPLLVRCEVLDGIRDPKAVAVKVNWNRKEFGPVDIAYNIKLLLDAGYTVEQVAKIYRRSEPWVYSLARIMKLPEEAIAKIANQGMSLRQAISFTEAWFRSNRDRRNGGQDTAQNDPSAAESARSSLAHRSVRVKATRRVNDADNVALVLRRFAAAHRRMRIRPVIVAVADYIEGSIGEDDLAERLFRFARAIKGAAG